MTRKIAIWIFISLVIIGLSIHSVFITHQRQERAFNVKFSEPLPSSLHSAPPKRHAGPQTVEALLESFGKIASNPAVDERYPQAEWLEMLLAKGIVIENYKDYSGYMVARGKLVALENQPEMWTSDIFGVPPTTNWETFKEAYIDRKIWEYQQVRAAEQAYPDVNGGLFTGPNRQIFLPSKPERVYVKREGINAIFFGEPLDETQEFNLLHRGIEPDGYEVIYIDETGKHLAEAPPPISREDIIKELTLPPDGWIPPDGWVPPPWVEQALRAKVWTGTFFPQDNTAQKASSNIDWDLAPVGEVEPASNEIEWTTHINIRESEKRDQLEDKHNMQGPAKPERSLSDITTWTDLEKQFMSDILVPPTTEHIEPTLTEHFNPEHLKRLSRAMETLHQYGPEEGLRKIKESDPEIAKQVENMLHTNN